MNGKEIFFTVQEKEAMAISYLNIFVSETCFATDYSKHQYAYKTFYQHKLSFNAFSSISLAERPPHVIAK